MSFRYIIKIISTVLVFSCASNSCFAQLNACIDTALEKNLDYKDQQLRTAISTKNIAIAKSYLFPTLKFENNYFVANGGRKIKFASGDLINPIYNELYQLTGNSNYNRTIPNFEEQFYPNNFYRSAFNISWAMVSKKAIFKYRSAQKLSEISAIQLELSKKSLIKDVKISYFEFYKVNKLLTFQDTLITYLNNVLFKTKKLVQYGYAAKIDIDQLKYEIAMQEQRKLELISNRDILQKQFSSLLGTSDFVCSFNDDDGNIDNFQIDSENDIKTKQELKVYELNQELIEFDKNSNNNWIPEVSLSLKSGFEGGINAINSDTDYFYLGALNLNWSLFEGRRAKYSKEQLDLKTKLNATRKEKHTDKLKNLLVQKLKNITTEKASLLLLTRKKELSFKILNHQKKKYLQGDIDITDLLNFKTKYEEDVTTYYQTKMSYIQHIIFYNWLIGS